MVVLWVMSVTEMFRQLSRMTNLAERNVRALSGLPELRKKGKRYYRSQPLGDLPRFSLVRAERVFAHFLSPLCNECYGEFFANRRLCWPDARLTTR